jgi:CheY-like chemotaxis protein
VQLDGSMPRMVVGDPTRLRQILVNLLNNAVKFTERGEVVLSVEARAGGDGRHEVHFAVRDTGIGIPADRIEEIFESFSQADASTSRRFGGTGLGLAISRRLCQAMGGEVDARSDGVRGAGSTFTFFVKLAPAGAASSPAREYDLAELAGKRVLIADANDATRRALAHQARAWGMVAVEATSARSALDGLGEYEPDVALIDARLPGADVAGLVRRARSLAGARRFAPILMSAVSDPHRPQRQIGFAGSLSKPVKQSSFYDSLVCALADHTAPCAAEERPARAESDDARLPLRILIAEDNPTNQRVVVQLLEKLGYGADVAANGLEALEAIQRRRYDVVLMDMMMPEMDGLDATRAIRETRPAGEQPHIIAVTANVAAEAREQCLQAGMDDYLSKPVSVFALRAALERAGASLDGGRGKKDEERRDAYRSG